MREMYAGVVSVCNEGGSVCAVVCVLGCVWWGNRRECKEDGVGGGGGEVVEENVRSKGRGEGYISGDLFSEKIYQKIPYSPPLPPSICLVTYISSLSVTFGLFVFKI